MVLPSTAVFFPGTYHGAESVVLYNTRLSIVTISFYKSLVVYLCDAHIYEQTTVFIVYADQ